MGRSAWRRTVKKVLKKHRKAIRKRPHLFKGKIPVNPEIYDMQL